MDRADRKKLRDEMNKAYQRFDEAVCKAPIFKTSLK